MVAKVAENRGNLTEQNGEYNLPKAFLERMQRLLGEEYEDFVRSYEEEGYHALRVNLLKCEVGEFLKLAPFALTPVPWCGAGFYYDAKERPGLHPYHEAGVYYIQEASAMAPAEYLKALPGERILDLCGAPGGKSTQIASMMKQQGVLVCNEIHPARAKILSENIERMGIRNAVVTNETPQRLARLWPEYFDRVLVDAPCSGEGMFRKNAEARKEWGPGQVALCAGRQDEILECALCLLKPGGRLVYSTCTFAPEEDEGTVLRLLWRHPELKITEGKGFSGMSAGEPGWGCQEGNVRDDRLFNTIRLWPHKLKGEGHFVAVLEKSKDRQEVFGGKQWEKSKDRQKACGNQIEALERGELFSAPSKRKAKGRGKSSPKELPKAEYEAYLEFRREQLLDANWGGTYVLFGQQLYLVPMGAPQFQGLRVLRPGLHLGTIKKNRFEPSHALALTLRPEQVRHVLRLAAGSQEVMGYLRGETLNAQGEKGWYLVTADGFGIGWGKLSGSVLKNHYPKGLRK